MTNLDSPASPSKLTIYSNQVTTSQLTLTAILLAVGVLAASFALCFGVMPKALNVEPVDPEVSITIGAFGLVVLLIVGVRLGRQIQRLDNDAERELAEPALSTTLFGRYLVGVGFALLLTALSSSMVFAGVAWSVGQSRLGHVRESSDGSSLHGDQWSGNDPAAEGAGDYAIAERFGVLFGNTPAEAFFTVALFVLSTMVALLGALFFFANALWAKMLEAEREPFDRRIFWGGLWFRLGEAVIFNLVFFLVLRYYAPESYLFLPLVSLLVGMFLKTGETLVSGIANRVFAAFEALVPTSLEAKGEPRLLTIDLAGLSDKPEERAKVVASLAANVSDLSGVLRVDSDAAAGKLRVQYDPARVSPARIRQEIALKGLGPKIVPQYA